MNISDTEISETLDESSATQVNAFISDTAFMNVTRINAFTNVTLLFIMSN